jgi:hypothetical protein
VENSTVRKHVASTARRAGYNPVILEGSRKLTQIEPTSSPLILETDNDVALLCQIVYKLYMTWPANTNPGIIALLSYAAMEHNPSVCVWEINGAAALVCLLAPDDSDSLMSILKMYAR